MKFIKKRGTFKFSRIWVAGLLFCTLSLVQIGHSDARPVPSGVTASDENHLHGNPGTNQEYHSRAAYLKPPELPLQSPLSLRGKTTHPLFKGIDTIDFTFGVLPDTQFYSKSYPETFKKINQWFVANQGVLNLKYVFHLGDIVNNVDEFYQWKTASEAMHLFEQAQIPYGVIAGNHDVGSRDNYTFYGRYFGENRFRSNSWYGGSYKNNKGHFDLINASGRKYIMLAMGWGIGESEIDWMNQVLRLYPKRTAILYVHDYLSDEGKRTQEGQMLFKKVVRGNANVRLVLNGHYSGAARRVDELDDNRDGKPDRQVMQILSDYQSVNGGEGFIRIMGFDLVHNRVYVRTFSPRNNRTHAYKEEEDNFSFHFDLKGK
ncbi:metallophosphoesterase [Sporolactobacillus pectinivorans]|uniref:metallophosphoesterase n=1 Tax=Sporolactobacillus pectinivorans TaxID=1591408 RepID=UPI000C268129|nr:metallophosphoesterase [Sporolactobacillus pectinivorans]